MAATRELIATGRMPRLSPELPAGEALERSNGQPIIHMSDLKLIALDADDLGVLSAHVQDAVLKVEEMTYQRRGKRFAAVLNRFDWVETLQGGKPRKRHHRRRAALRIERVKQASLTGIDLKAKQRVLVLLAIIFEPSVAPGGWITLVFAGDAAIRLEVECIEAELRDLGAAWLARSRPDHEDGADKEAAKRKS